MANNGKNPWRCGGKCVTSHRKWTKRQAYDVFFMGETAAEEVSGQAAVDAGRGVYLALHGAAAVRRGGGEALRRIGATDAPDGRGGDGPLSAAAVGGRGRGEVVLQNLWAADGGHGLAHLDPDGYAGARLPHGLPVAAGRRPAALHRPAAFGGGTSFGLRLSHELMRRHPSGAQADTHGAA